MALRYIDSMGDHYTAAQAPLKWTSTVNAIRETGVHGYGMRGGFTKGMLFPSNTLIMEVYFKRLNAEQIFSIFDTGQNTQIRCGYSSDGSLWVSRYGSNPATDTIWGSAPDLVRTGTWYHFGWRVFVHPTAGTVEVRFNGETLCSITGIRTTWTIAGAVGPYWSGTVGGFQLGTNANATVWDDLIVMDGVEDGVDDVRLPGGGGFDKFIGPVEIRVKRPNAPGLAAEWSPVPAPPNWENVNDIESDADTTYNTTTVAQVGATDLFNMEDVAAGEDVVGVQSLILSRKTEEGVAAIATLTHDGSTTTVGTTVYQPNTYSYIHTAEPTLPDGSLWTAATWDAIQYGYRRMV